MFGQGFNSGFFGGPNYIYKEDIFGDNSCIGLYTMDYDFSNSSGNDNDMGVFGNPDHGVSGGLNLGARFDGYNDSARAYPVSDLQGLTAVSISFWFKWDDSTSVSNYGHMVNIGDMGGVGNGDAFGIAVGDDGGSYNRVLYGWFPEGSLSTGQTVTDNVWHHVLMTYSGTTVKYYYDGNSTPIATQTRTSLSLPNSAVNRITVGHYAYNGNHHFKGDLDHLRVFNREIQSSELAALYNEKFYSPSATTNNIAYPITNTAYYKLDNSSKDFSGGGNDGTDTNIEYRFGRFGQAAVFNGSSSYIDTGNSIISTGAFSVSFWVNINSHSTNSASFVSNNSNSGSVGFDIRQNGANNKLDFYFGAGSSFISSDSALTTDVWTHAVCTYDGSNMKMYVNKDLQTSTDTGTLSAASNNLYIGKTAAFARYFNGSIDQVRIYSTALTSDQVTQLYNEKPETDTSNFKAVLYEGTGANQYISNVGFEPDLVWIKSRDKGTTPYTGSHYWFDSIRGALQRIKSNDADGENTFSNSLTSFDTNGFSLGSGSNVNYNGDDFVAWVWKAGGDAVIGTGTGVSNVSVSANTDAGFSIVKYTGGNGASDTVNHGLTDAEMILLKDLDDGTNNWRAWHKDLTANHWMYLNLNNQEASAATDGGIRNVDANTFGFINGTTAGVEGVNSSASNYIAYVWKSISGYSSIGTYTGTGASGNSITTGFEPSFLMVKGTTIGGNWLIFDNKRPNNALFANLTNTDSPVTTNNNFSFNSNGFTSLGAGSSANSNGDTYLYIAFK